MGYSSQQAIAEDIRWDVQRQLSDDAFAELEAIFILCVLSNDPAQALAAIRKRAAAILRRRDEEA
jgi:hypothetical protein